MLGVKLNLVVQIIGIASGVIQIIGALLQLYQQLMRPEVHLSLAKLLQSLANEFFIETLLQLYQQLMRPEVHVWLIELCQNLDIKLF